MRRNYFRRTPRTPRRTRHRRNDNLLGKLSGRRNNLLLVLIIIAVVYVLWRYPDINQRLMPQSPPIPSFPQARPRP